jgi:GDSL-like Lipase/Acylhydrolase family
VRRWLPNVFILVVALLLGLVLAEVVLQVAYPFRDELCVFPPRLSYTLEPDSSVLYGIHGIKHFTTDRLGIRTISGCAPAEIQCLFMGGSATECLYLDDHETWCALLANKLQVKAGSVGKSGQTTLDHCIQLKYFTPQLPKLKTIVILCGLNDWIKVLADTSRHLRYDDNLADLLCKTSFTHSSSFTSSHSFRLVSLLRSSYRQLVPDTTGQAVQDIHGHCYAEWRLHRAANTTALLPLDTVLLTHALADYDSNIRQMIATARERHLKLIFISQLAAWADSTAIDKCWMGGTGRYQLDYGHSYYDRQVLQYGLDRYNDKTAAICGELGVTYIDMRDKVPHPATLFYDDCHYHQAGAKIWAETLYIDWPK